MTVRQSPLEVTRYLQDANEPTTVAVYTDDSGAGELFESPEGFVRFAMIHSDGDYYATVGTSTYAPTILNTGSMLFPEGNTWLQLPRDAVIRLGGVEGPVEVTIVWAG